MPSWFADAAQRLLDDLAAVRDSPSDPDAESWQQRSGEIQRMLHGVLLFAQECDRYNPPKKDGDPLLRQPLHQMLGYFLDHRERGVIPEIFPSGEVGDHRRPTFEQGKFQGLIVEASRLYQRNAKMTGKAARERALSIAKRVLGRDHDLIVKEGTIYKWMQIADGHRDPNSTSEPIRRNVEEYATYFPEIAKSRFSVSPEALSVEQIDEILGVSLANGTTKLR
ncbi:MAG: hypothetical protein AAF830_01885 [Pseudomonadota bacterium]